MREIASSIERYKEISSCKQVLEREFYAKIQEDLKYKNNKLKRDLDWREGLWNLNFGSGRGRRGGLGMAKGGGGVLFFSSFFFSKKQPPVAPPCHGVGGEGGGGL